MGIPIEQPKLLSVMAKINSMKPITDATAIALLMVVIALGANSVSTSPARTTAESRVKLEELVPESFAGWRLSPATTAVIVNPQAQETIERIYGQVLSRTYVNANGYVVMLSIAHGEQQKRGFGAHMPELCYPAAGFSVGPTELGQIMATQKPLQVKRLRAQYADRIEPITYWFRLGNRTIGGVSSLERRMVELKFALDGKVPDGLLVRVSSIDPQVPHAYSMQEQFTADLLTSVDNQGRRFLTGD